MGGRGRRGFLGRRSVVLVRELGDRGIYISEFRNGLASSLIWLLAGSLRGSYRGACWS